MARWTQYRNTAENDIAPAPAPFETLVVANVPQASESPSEAPNDPVVVTVEHDGETPV